MLRRSRFSTRPSLLRDHPTPHLSKDPSSRLYMPPDTIVPYPWVVDSDHVLDGFEATYDGGYNLRAVPTPIAHECSEHVYLLDDGSRYLLWYRISDEMAEIIKPVKLGDIMDAFAHDEVESKRVEAS